MKKTLYEENEILIVKSKLRNWRNLALSSVLFNLALIVGSIIMYYEDLK